MVDDYKAIVRTRYGLIAKNVSEEKIFSHAPKNSRQWQVIKKGIKKKWSGEIHKNLTKMIAEDIRFSK